MATPEAIWPRQAQDPTSMEHTFALLKPNGFNAQINVQSWMFHSSYEQLREWLS